MSSLHSLLNLFIELGKEINVRRVEDFIAFSKRVNLFNNTGTRM